MKSALRSTCGLQSVERFRTRIRFLKKMGIFFSGLAYRPHLSGENGHRKRTFQKRSPEWRFLKTRACRLLVDGRKRSLEYDDVIHHIQEAFRILCKACSRISIVLALSRGRNTLLVDARFLENGGIRFPC